MIVHLSATAPLTMVTLVVETAQLMSHAAYPAPTFERNT